MTTTENYDPETGEIIDQVVADVTTGEPVAVATAPKLSDLARVDGPPEGETDEAIRARKVIMVQQMIPDENWIMREVVAKGKGSRAFVGKVVGLVRGFEEKSFTQKDGRVTESIALRGEFRPESYHTNEVQTGTTCYLPGWPMRAQVAAVFKDVPAGSIRTVEIDCDIGLEATGKPIPYEWLVVAYLEGREMDTLRKLSRRRGRPAGAPGGPLIGAAPSVAQIGGAASGGAPAALAGPVDEGTAPEGLRDVTPEAGQ